MRIVADAKQSVATPLLQAIDLHSEQFDFRPVIELGDSILQERPELDNIAMQSWQTTLFDLIEIAFRNHKTDLEVIATVEQHEEFPVLEKSERLERIIRAFGKTHPQDIDRCTEIAEFEICSRMGDGMPAVGADHEIGINVTLAFGRFRAHTDDAIIFN